MYVYNKLWGLCVVNYIGIAWAGHIKTSLFLFKGESLKQSSITSYVYSMYNWWFDINSNGACLWKMTTEKSMLPVECIHVYLGLDLFYQHISIWHLTKTSSPQEECYISKNDHWECTHAHCYNITVRIGWIF